MYRKLTVGALLFAASTAGAQATATLPVSETPTSSLVIADTNPTHGTIGPRLTQARYDAIGSQYRGVVKVEMFRGTTALGSCSGSLLWTGFDILTAAHCVANAGGATATSAKIRFRGATNSSSSDVVINSASIVFNAAYTGNVVDEADVALIRLGALAPSFATRYQLFSGDPLNTRANYSGWGLVGDGNTGDAFQFGGAGRRLQGSNRWEATMDDATFGMTNTNSNGILVYDFDNGSADRNSMCTAGWTPAPTADLCDAGFGEDEVALGRGDSGGPGFVGGKIAGVASWVTSGLKSDGTACARVSCFGAFGAHTNMSYAPNSAWVGTHVTPEPASLVLMASGLLGVGFAVRRRRSSK